MADKYETSIYTKKQLNNARTKGQVKGWVQGAASTFLFLLLMKFVGLIPAIAVLGGLGYLGYRIFSAGKETIS
ncbi:MAG: hypothetical protein IH853_06125 [Bacteroidetes bacterium]|nr:hypothetical protein [Bacteroidota bacterium]MCH8244895.1 hypothetical protein [Bacteroidota bacterium]